MLVFTSSVLNRDFFGGGRGGGGGGGGGGVGGKFGPKNQNCQLKLKLSTLTNSNMQNSMLVFTFYVFHPEYPF